MLQYSEVSDFIENSQIRNQYPNVIITSGNDTIGFQILKNLYSEGANIIFGGIDQDQNQGNLFKLKSLSSNGYVKCHALDLTSKSSIQDFASYIRKIFQSGNIDILINNSELLQAGGDLTQLNIDKIMQANVFGHFYLTHLLFDMLAKSKEARIINFSNMAYRHVQSANTLTNIYHNQKSYHAWDQYAKSKLANVQFTVTLAKKLKQRGYNIKTVALYPGVVRKRIAQEDEGVLGKMINLVGCLREPRNKCSQTPLYLSRVEYKKLKSGQYYNEAKKIEELSQQARNIKSSQDLWKFGQDLYNIKFNI